MLRFVCQKCKIIISILYRVVFCCKTMVFRSLRYNIKSSDCMSWRDIMVRWQDEVKSFARMLFPAFIMFVASMPCSGLADNILIGGTGYWSPYCYSNSDNGSNLQGFTVDVVKYVFRNKGNVKFVKLPWKRCLRMLDEGQLDLVMDGSKNSDRLQKYLFSDQLYHLDSVFFYNRFRYPRGFQLKILLK